MRPPAHLRRAAARALALGAAAALTAVLGTTAPATAAPAPGQAYRLAPSGGESAAANRAFFEAVLKSVAAKRAASPHAESVTVTYSSANAPSFQQYIANAAQIWNGSVTNVQLQEGANADFSYYEGNDPRGSYADTDGHGRGYIFIDYSQTQQYDPLRVTAHETGHVLGLPDDYQGPCSELMSGGGPGPSCTNPYPDENERARVDQLWANGLAKALRELQKK